MNMYLKSAMIGLLTITLAACGGSGGSGGSSNDEADKRFLRGISAKPDTVDPHLASGQWENDIIGDMFIGLYTENENAEPVLGMAAEEPVVSDDGLIWTFKLRDAKWSDGQPVTAHDFEYAIQRILKPETAAQYASLIYLYKNAQAVNSGDMSPEAVGVKALDDKTLQIELEYPAPYLPGLLTHYTSFPVPKHVIEAHGDQWTRPENIVVNGAFKLVEWRTGDYLKVDKNPEFYDVENVCFNEVYYFPYENLDTVLNLIRRGRLDFNNNFEGQKLEEIRRDIPEWVSAVPANVISYYVFNNEVAPFDDARVRNALAMAVDRDFMINEILRAGEIPAYNMIPPIVANYPGGVQADWASLDYDGRLARAKTLLEEAGFGPDNPLQFTLKYRSTADQRVFPAVQNNWREIADWVRPEIERVDTRVFYNMLRAGDFEVGDAGWIADYNDAQNFLYLLDSRTGAMNYGNYANAEFDALMDQSNYELDMEKRGNIMKSAEEMMIADMPIIPMWFQVNKVLVNPRITGYEGNATRIHRTRFMCKKASVDD